MPSSKELREERAALVPEIRKMADLVDAEKRDFSAEEQEKWDKINASVDALKDRIERQEHVEGLEASAVVKIEANQRRDEKPADAGDLATRAHKAWFKHQQGVGVSDEEREAARECGINLDSANLDIRLDRKPMSLREARAMTSATTAGGGGLVAPEFVPSVELALLDFSGVRQAADIIRTDTGADFPWPTIDDTSNSGNIEGENDAVAETDVTMGEKVWKAYKFSSDLVRVPVELLEDSAISIPELVGALQGERIARKQETQFTTGVGANSPRGIVTASVLGVTAAATGAIAADEVIDLIYSVDPAYQNAMGAGFMAHNNIVKALRKLKDGSGNYLWVNGDYQAGEPDRILGYPIFKNQSMQSSIATATKTMLFGDLKKYKIRDVRGIRVRRLVERYADSDQEGFVAFMRSDGNLLDAGTNPVKHLVQA